MGVTGIPKAAILLSKSYFKSQRLDVLRIWFFAVLVMNWLFVHTQYNELILPESKLENSMSTHRSCTLRSIFRSLSYMMVHQGWNQHQFDVLHSLFLEKESSIAVAPGIIKVGIAANNLGLSKASDALIMRVPVFYGRQVLGCSGEEEIYRCLIRHRSASF